MPAVLYLHDAVALARWRVMSSPGSVETTPAKAIPSGVPFPLFGIQFGWGGGGATHALTTFSPPRIVGIIHTLGWTMTLLPRREMSYVRVLEHRVIQSCETGTVSILLICRNRVAPARTPVHSNTNPCLAPMHMPPFYSSPLGDATETGGCDANARGDGKGWTVEKETRSEDVVGG